MRCSKCSFISFDDLSACAKCATDLSILSKELNGTCTETRQEFFLGSAIQSTGQDEDNFSESQVLPLIENTDMDFDDTSTGGFSPFSSPDLDSSNDGNDNSIGFAAEDDVAIELGDIMPIDLEQLDSGSVLDPGVLEVTDALSYDDSDFDLDKTSSISGGSDKGNVFESTGDFVDFDSKHQLVDDFSDIDINDSSFELTIDAVTDVDHSSFGKPSESDINFDDTALLDFGEGLNETTVSTLSFPDDGPAPLELDDSLVAELAGTSSLDVSGEFSADFSVEPSASGEFELDAALVAELASDADTDIDNSAIASADIPAAVVGFEYPLEFEGQLSGEGLQGSVQFDDLTGEFPPIREDDDAELASLDLADIDVSDLVDPSDRELPSVLDGRLVDSRSETLGSGSLDGQDLHFDGVAFADAGLSSNYPSLSLDDTLDDTLRDGGVSVILSPPGEHDLFEEDMASSFDEQAAEGLEIPDDIEPLALDVDFAAYFDKNSAADKISDIDFSSEDDDDDAPPDLPS